MYVSFLVALTKFTKSTNNKRPPRPDHPVKQCFVLYAFLQSSKNWEEDLKIDETGSEIGHPVIFLRFDLFVTYL